MPAAKRWVERREELLKVPDTDECVPFRGRIKPNGYGMIGQQYAHRLSYETHVGPIPEGLEIDHLCRNRACINFRHLEPVTHSENALRGLTGYHPKTTLRKLNDDQVRYIRSSAEPAPVLGRVFGVNRETVRQVRTGQLYKEVV